MTPTHSEINRSLVGLCALVCLGAALALWLFYREHYAAMYAFLRVGVVLAALWFALPVLRTTRFLDRLTPLIIGGMVLLAIFQKRFVVLAPLAAALAVLTLVLRPRPKQRPNSAARRS